MLDAQEPALPITKATDPNATSLFMQAPAMICILEGPELRCNLANPLFSKLYEGRLLLGRTPREVAPELEGQGYFEMLDSVFQTGKPVYGNEYPGVADWDGNGTITTKYFNLVYSPYKANGTTAGVMIFGFEVTEQVLARQEAEKRQTLINTISKAAPTCLWICDANADCIFINEAWIRWTGKPLKEHLGARWSDSLIDEDRKPAYQAFLQSHQTQQPYQYEFRIKCADASIKWCLSSGGPWYQLNGEFGGIAGSVVDITDQKQEVNRIRSMVDALPLMAWTAKPDGNVDYLNRRWYAYTGQTPEEALGRGWASVMPIDTEESVYTKWKYALEHTTPYEVEVKYRNQKGEYRWHIVRAEPIKNESGTLLYWLGTSTDIHDQKTLSQQLERKIQERTNELISSNLALKRSNEDLEQFVSVASHDLKEPLRKILFYSDRYQQAKHENATEYARKVTVTANRMMSLIEDLLEFGTLGSPQEQFEQVDLNIVLEDVKQDLELAIQEKDAHIASDGLPVVKAILHQMRQLFSNLISNAIKYSKTSEPPQISISVTKTTSEELKRFPTLDIRQSYCTLTFRDNGIGFDAADAERIFTIFQRLHSRYTYSGSGVGLALCRKIVHNHRGEIYATSQAYVGSTFFVVLPL